MEPFESYGQYYDWLYQDKDYAKECDFIETIFNEFINSKITDLLDLGCGTGGHAFELVKRGYRVVGVDRSESMLEVGRSKLQKTNIQNLSFIHNEIGSLNLNTTFDAVIAMFAVMSYMTSNDELLAALNSTRSHLKQGGCLIFYVWFGPSVISQRPTERSKILQKGTRRLIRLAYPELHMLDQTIDVHYKLFELEDNQLMGEFNETHSMRFFFPQELTLALDIAGFTLVKIIPFMEVTGEVDEKTWNITVVAEAQ